MKSRKLFVIALLWAATPSTHAVDSPIARELQALKTNYDKATAMAVDPIRQRYQAALEQLLRRATQLKDADGMAHVKETLDAVSAPPPSTVATKLSARTLSRKLLGSVWTATDGFWLPRIEILANDKARVLFKDGKSFPYPFKVTADDEITFQIDANPTTVIKFAQDLKSAASGTFELKRE